MTDTIMTTKDDKLAIVTAREAAFKSLLKSCKDDIYPREKAKNLLTLLGVDVFVQGAFSANLNETHARVQYGAIRHDVADFMKLVNEQLELAHAGVQLVARADIHLVHSAEEE
jgi:hypothetical protein